MIMLNGSWARTLRLSHSWNVPWFRSAVRSSVWARISTARWTSAFWRAIEAAGRDTDRVFRYGGDEFALILPGADSVAALGVAERVRTAVHALGDAGTGWANAGLRVSVSIGVATFPRDGLTSEAILLAADRACFVAKLTGHGLIATADEGLAIARDFAFKAPTPIDVTGSGEDGRTPVSAEDPAVPVAGAGLSVGSVVPLANPKPRRPADAAPVS